jgi:hypothetical protein
MKTLLSVGMLIAAMAASVAVSAAPTNPHQAHDQKMRACRAEAKAQNLGGAEAEAYIAACMKR